MSSYSSVQITLGVWAIVTAIYVVLFVYRAIVGAKEEDSVFLSAGESRMAEEQRQIMVRVKQVEPATNAFGIATAVMTVVLIGVWGYSVFHELF